VVHVVPLRVLVVEEVEDVGAQDDPPIVGHPEGVVHPCIHDELERSALPEAVDGLDAGPPDAVGDLAGAGVDGVGVEPGQRAPGSGVDAERQAQVLEGVVAVDLDLVGSVVGEHAAAQGTTLVANVALVAELRAADRGVAGVVDGEIEQRRDRRVCLLVVVPEEPFEVALELGPAVGRDEGPVVRESLVGGHLDGVVLVDGTFLGDGVGYLRERLDRRVAGADVRQAVDQARGGDSQRVRDHGRPDHVLEDAGDGAVDVAHAQVDRPDGLDLEAPDELLFEGELGVGLVDFGGDVEEERIACARDRLGQAGVAVVREEDGGVRGHGPRGEVVGYPAEEAREASVELRLARPREVVRGADARREVVVEVEAAGNRRAGPVGRTRQGVVGVAQCRVATDLLLLVAHAGSEGEATDLPRVLEERGQVLLGVWCVLPTYARFTWYTWP
jgi:hypothetical protein